MTMPVRTTILRHLLKTNIDIAKYSQDRFDFKLPSELIPNRTAEFLAKLQASDSVQKYYSPIQYGIRLINC